MEPTRALRLGPHEGEDFVDLLIRLIPENHGVVKQTMTLCLMSYQDQRTGDFLARAFATSRDAATVLHLGQRLLLDRGPEFFRPFLWSDKAAQALAAARVCHDTADPREQLRIALLIPDARPPEITEETRDAWLAELTGPHRARAMQLAEGYNTRLLSAGWTRLDDPQKAWWLGLHPDLVEQLLPTSNLAVVAHAAHHHNLKLPAHFLVHDDPEVRALAIAAGWGDENLTHYLGATLPEALAATRRCPPEQLLELLTDERWPVRAEAVRALETVEPPRLAEVRALVNAGELGQRAAAVDLLQRWGDDDWLARTLV